MSDEEISRTSDFGRGFRIDDSLYELLVRKTQMGFSNINAVEFLTAADRGGLEGMVGYMREHGYAVRVVGHEPDGTPVIGLWSPGPSTTRGP
jgi:hypothetical protein